MTGAGAPGGPGIIKGLRQDKNIDLLVCDSNPNASGRYLNEKFEPQRSVLKGLAARVVQHEYDHIEGILFTDKLSSLKKRLIKKKLDNITKGKIKTDYRMRFYSPKKK